MIAIIGPFPPPVHGMAKNLKIFFDDVSTQEQVLRIDISPGVIKRGGGYHATKFIKVLIGLCRLFFNVSTRRISAIYMPPDAGWGTFYSILFAIVARIFRTPIYMHHRSFNYINAKKRKMSFLVKLTLLNGNHIFLCENMKERFESLYGVIKNFSIVSNAQYVYPVTEVNEVETDEIVLGHLSNLGFGKGIKEVIEVCEKLTVLGVNYSLELAGPAENSAVEEFLLNKMEEGNLNINYHGPVFGDDKKRFYEKLDLFLFPSTYCNEAQPNVVFEANSNAIPVLTIAVGCISEDVDSDNGIVFDDKEHFVKDAAQIILGFSESRSYLEKVKLSTLKAIEIKSDEARLAYSALITQVLSHKRK